jgi:hypothetical protein
MTCRKAPGYRTKAEAIQAARVILSATMDLGRWRAYTCRRCRIDQAPAWHWGHLNRGRAK